MWASLGSRSGAIKFAASLLTGIVVTTGAAFGQCYELTGAASSTTPLHPAGPAVEIDESKLFADLNLPTYVWNIPKEKPKAIIMGFHGGCLHGRSYKTLAKSLADQDIMFVTYDMRGFGKWYHEGYGTKRDRPFKHEQSFRDGQAILGRLREKYPDVPIVGMGESFGAFMALETAERDPKLLDGLILVSNSDRVRFFLSPYMLVQLVQAVTNPFRRYDLSYYLKRKISHKHEACMQEVEDPLNRNKQNVAELIRSGLTIMKISRHAKDIPSNMPVLCINGEIDKLCRTSAARKMFNRLPSTEKEYVEVQNHGHLLVETPYMEMRVQKVISQWIGHVADQRIASKGVHVAMKTEGMTKLK